MDTMTLLSIAITAAASWWLGRQQSPPAGPNILPPNASPQLLSLVQAFARMAQDALRDDDHNGVLDILERKKNTTPPATSPTPPKTPGV